VAKRAEVPDWETLLAHAAVHSRHRFSIDHDHVVANLAKNYDAAIRALETITGWRTSRRVKGKMVLGSVGGIAAGLRNLRRSVPLETTEVSVGGGRIRLPTIGETLRIKTFLVVDRNATRDYLDVAALSHSLGLRKSAVALERMNEIYSEFAGEGGDMLTSALVKLAAPDPYDLTDIDLTEYKGIIAPWNNWRAVQVQCAALAAAILSPPAASKRAD
jgi:hypothetical protein